MSSAGRGGAFSERGSFAAYLHIFSWSQLYTKNFGTLGWYLGSNGPGKLTVSPRNAQAQLEFIGAAKALVQTRRARATMATRVEEERSGDEQRREHNVENHRLPAQQGLHVDRARLLHFTSLGLDRARRRDLE